ncbi:chemotaxis protein CheC [Vibrio sp. SCSIO 43132]|uniref:chemotaxis protein CheC n=1 Tax=Vibrio sp. SCSIO 43132 TaxID=2779363 RepID=UPI001CA91D14|nr:chemotaxis protein CheC [Vibrio sp. SCSIO 43132]UAB72181.1 chemotaxis protein CheC [Vibrio sp. SCSIO 43132]
MNIEFTPDHKDALQELMNISMGRAASKLATLIDLHVTLSIPNIRVAKDDDLRDLETLEESHYYTRQSFFGGIDGELITLLSKEGCHHVVKSLHNEEAFDVSTELLADSILDVSNILSGASLKGLSQQMELTTKIHSPVLFEPSKQPLPVSDWQLALVMEISFLVEEASFEAKSVVCFADNDLENVISLLDELI